MSEMKVAVVTPYHKEDEDILRQCHDSVAAQTHPCTHFMVADGHPLETVASRPVQHFALPKEHADNGNTPRAIGSLSAINQGFDAIAYLDADNWYFSNHIEEMVRLHQTSGAVVCSAGRTINRLDGSLMYVDEHESDGKQHVDTSCLFLTRKAFKLVPYWAMMPRELGPNCDRIIWSAICTRQMPHAHNSDPTVAFRTRYKVHYRHMGETPPPGARSNDETTGVSSDWWRGLEESERQDWQIYFGTGQW